MPEKKIIDRSSILDREYHIDLLEPEEGSSFMILFFGGSGTGPEEYQRRKHSVVPIFHHALAELWREIFFTFVYVTAPFDLSFNQFPDQEEEARRWEKHVLGELLPRLPRLPFYTIGYSGGLVLALHSVFHHERCFGCGALGGDRVPEDLETPENWEESLTLIYNIDDRVFDANQEAIEALEIDGAVKCFRRLPGEHPLSEYVANQSFSGLIRRAGRLFHPS